MVWQSRQAKFAEGAEMMKNSAKSQIKLPKKQQTTAKLIHNYYHFLLASLKFFTTSITPTAMVISGIITPVKIKTIFSTCEFFIFYLFVAKFK